MASIAVPTAAWPASTGPLLEVVRDRAAQPSATKLFSAIALFALANGALINMIMASRVRLRHGRARASFPRSLGRVHASTADPWVAIVFTTAVAMALVASGDLGELADTTVLLLLFVFTAVNIAVLILRRDLVPHSHFRAPTPIPVIGAGVSIALMTTKDLEIFIRAGALLAVGIALWALNWWVHGRHANAYDSDDDVG